eukprot:Gb_04535 [translate_table: standard]
MCTSCTDIYRLRRELSQKEQSCLIENECEDLMWYVESQSLEGAILHWHIATSLCEMSSELQSATDLDKVTKKKNEEMSKILSRYCAYLLHCYTELLPVNANFAKMVYKRACSEIYDLGRSVLAKIKAHSSDLKKKAFARGVIKAKREGRRYGLRHQTRLTVARHGRREKMEGLCRYVV